MVVLDVGMQRGVVLISNDVTDGLAGTGTGTPTETQTGLESPVAATEADVSVTVSNKSFQTSHIIPATTGTGLDYAEWSVRMNSDATTYSRALTVAVNHTENDEITKITTFNFRNE